MNQLKFQIKKLQFKIKNYNKQPNSIKKNNDK